MSVNVMMMAGNLDGDGGRDDNDDDNQNELLQL